MRRHKQEEKRVLGAERPVSKVPNRAAEMQAIAHKGPGAPLDPVTRKALERLLGADLSHMRIHKDLAAHEAADMVNARAFTHATTFSWLAVSRSTTYISWLTS